MLGNVQENTNYCYHYNLLLWVQGGWEEEQCLSLISFSVSWYCLRRCLRVNYLRTLFMYLLLQNMPPHVEWHGEILLVNHFISQQFCNLSWAQLGGSAGLATSSQQIGWRLGSARTLQWLGFSSLFSLRAPLQVTSPQILSHIVARVLTWQLRAPRHKRRCCQAFLSLRFGTGTLLPYSFG